MGYVPEPFNRLLQGIRTLAATDSSWPRQRWSLFANNIHRWMFSAFMTDFIQLRFSGHRQKQARLLDKIIMWMAPVWILYGVLVVSEKSRAGPPLSTFLSEFLCCKLPLEWPIILYAQQSMVSLAWSLNLSHITQENSTVRFITATAVSTSASMSALISSCWCDKILRLKAAEWEWVYLAYKPVTEHRCRELKTGIWSNLVSHSQEQRPFTVTWAIYQQPCPKKRVTLPPSAAINSQWPKGPFTHPCWNFDLILSSSV